MTRHEYNDQPTHYQNTGKNKSAVLIIALVLGLSLVIVLGIIGTSALVYFSLSQRPASQPELVTAWKFNRSIPKGQTIKAGDLIQVKVPGEFKDELFKDLYTEQEEIDLFVTGLRSTRDIPQGAYARAFWVNGTDPSTHSALSVKDSEEAVYIPLEPDSSPQYLRPGNRVNIRATFTLPVSGRMTTMLVAQNIMVRQVNGQSNFGVGGPVDSIHQITIVVQAEEASMLHQALQHSSNRRMFVTLVSANSSEEAMVNGFGIQQAIDAMNRERQQPTTVIIDKRDKKDDDDSSDTQLDRLPQSEGDLEF